MAEVSGRRVTVTGVASGDLNIADPANYRFLIKADTKKVALASTSGAIAYGVLNNKPKNNEHATVVIDGFTKVTVGTSLGPDVLVMNSGRAVGRLVRSRNCRQRLTR